MTARDWGAVRAAVPLFLLQISGAQTFPLVPPKATVPPLGGIRLLLRSSGREKFGERVRADPLFSATAGPKLWKFRVTHLSPAVLGV